MRHISHAHGVHINVFFPEENNFLLLNVNSVVHDNLADDLDSFEGTKRFTVPY